ncbi:MAG: CAP domain-containing protein [Planctomycetota bacterium]|nr:CAP domain-containing protein [Planctomycetota bacterium]
MQFLLTVLLCWLWPAPYKPTPEMRAMHRAHLEIRSEYELPAQRLDPNCCQIAQKWAEYLARTGRFHHGGGEQIIACGIGDEQLAFSLWIGSRPHRAWLLSDAEFCGWGSAKSANGRTYWAGCFRKRALPQPAPGDS